MTIILLTDVLVTLLRFALKRDAIVLNVEFKFCKIKSEEYEYSTLSDFYPVHVYYHSSRLRVDVVINAFALFFLCSEILLSVVSLVVFFNASRRF